MARVHPLHPLAALSLLAVPAIAQQAPSLSASARGQLAAFESSSAWNEFRDQAGGQWRIEWCAATGTPRAIWGSGLALADWRENTLDEARRHANQLLRDRAGLLGLGDSDFRESIGSRMGRTWVLVYDQYFHGVPVVGGRADVRVNMTGRVPMFGSTAWQIPATFSTTPAISGEAATALAWTALGEAPTGVAQPAPVAAPRLVIWGDAHARSPMTAQLAWEIAVSNVDAAGKGTIGRYYIDATNGGVLNFTNDKHECGIPGCSLPHAKAPALDLSPMAPPVLTTVTVMAWTRTGVDAYSALTNVPLPGLELTVPGVGTVTTDANGQFTVNIAAAVNITVGQLNGRHHSPILGGTAPSGSFTVNPGVNSTIQLLTSGATVAAAAHTTTSFWCDAVNEWSRSILGNSAQLAAIDSITPTVNIASTCNAYYTNNTINFYSAGGGCSNTANATVIAHEWGHGIDEQYGGLFNLSGEGLSEGWGDIIGMYLVDSPLLGSGFQTAGVALRDGNNVTQYGTQFEVHAAGESWMGFAWKLRDRLATTLGNRPAAIAVSNDIVMGSIVANASDQPGAVIEVFIADDDDGNLLNGTPHSVDLILACNQHSLPYPGQGGTVAFGTGCNRGSTAFYEEFGSPSFDLSGSAMTLLWNGAYYTAVPAGSYVAPSGAATSLALTDDSSTSVTLSGAFPYAGGTTNTLTVCSNGFVSPSNSNGTGYTPSASGWLGSTAPRWGTWHDFNPGAAGSGAVKFEQIGTVAYITWQGVYSYATTAANTWQLQLDRSNGNVTYVWQTIVSSGNGWLVGYAGTAPNADLGSLDISVALPGGFATSATNVLPLALVATPPHIGQTTTLSTTEFPVGSLLGVQVISMTKFDPGIDLSVIGMPTCSLYAQLDNLQLLFPVNQSATYGLAIPNNPALIGAEVVTQSAAFDSAANAAGLISSNGLSLILAQ